MAGNVYLMSAIPASGKSSYIIDKMDMYEDEWVSRNTIRFSILEDNDGYFAKEKEVFKEFINTINDALRDGKNVYVDATHINKKSRAKTLNRLDRSNITSITCIWIDTPFAVCMERNNRRQGMERVPDNAMRDMYKNFEPPQLDEGFDEIIRVE